MLASPHREITKDIKGYTQQHPKSLSVALIQFCFSFLFNMLSLSHLKHHLLFILDVPCIILFTTKILRSQIADLEKIGPFPEDTCSRKK